MGRFRRRILRWFASDLAPLIREGHGLALTESVVYDPTGSGGDFFGYGDSDADAELAAEDLGWIPVGGGSLGLSKITNRRQLIEKCAGLYFLDPVAKNIVNNYTFFVVGTGFTVSVSGGEAKQDAFEKWAEKAEWEERVEEAVRTMTLLGEAFLVRFPFRDLGAVGFEGPTSAPVRQETGAGSPTPPTDFRVLDPMRMPSIAVNPEDLDDPWGYALSRRDGKTTWVHPDDVVHLRFGRLGGAVYGTPILMPAIVPLNQLGKFAENRYYLNWVRARFPVIRKITSPTASASKEKTKLDYENLPKPGSVIFDKGPVEWQFPNLNIGSGDVWNDWRVLVLRVASAVSLPEYLVVQDASNSNYSSSIVAESPAHQMFRSLQRTVACRLERLLGPFFPGSEIEVVPSPIETRDPESKANALASMLDRGVISKETAAREAGFEWDGKDGERARIMREKTAAMVAFGPGGPEPQLLARGRFAPAAANGNGEEEPPEE